MHIADHFHYFYAWYNVYGSDTAFLGSIFRFVMKVKIKIKRKITIKIQLNVYMHKELLISSRKILIDLEKNIPNGKILNLKIDLVTF